ncbi:hypothetical protein [Paraburkholderia caribensis]|uniref:hypothetical protein n=1 Tax=Paraburkholderia TaxID=1822464 RepID=UPI001CAB68AC|nr:hypothetical protein [Paraburkholderia caribensis]BEU25806.1 hypothetical protein PBP221_59460 [Paraburkholderia sp. 22B1P]CAG9250968.1 hypothetical protein PCAR4_290076 [Paraburkholderia caribensis]
MSALKTTVVNGVGVGSFTQASSENTNQIMCRAVGPIKTPDGESFAEFVKSGFVSELKIAGVYAPAALSSSPVAWTMSVFRR